MIEREVVIVGGGPAGSSCAWRLARHGIASLILDRAVFPRLKLCAGWITPEVVADLEIDPATYPHGFLTFERLRVHLGRVGFPLGTVQHSIRRSEFDAWLLARSGAEVVTHTVRTIVATARGYELDGRFRCRWLVGAGGTRCPVYRALFREAWPRDEALQAAVLEEEFAYGWQDPDCHLWFFANGLPGYSWYVPKAAGWLNVGIGGMATRLAAKSQSIKTHFARLASQLGDAGLVRNHAWATGGYAYYLRGSGSGAGPRLGNAFVIGDAAGLATRDMAEGIGPAVRSGLLVADAIATDAAYDLSAIARHSLPNRWAALILDRAMAGRR
jgi:flavin-dependent dehydrogenase